ncbi:hypothetical protein [Abyssalbus ytuae]|uniref:TonB C-terminal domain-containing protein n=1 Tax=Abyssalbus ytuae TaxID=2926907 RepID=A0A9E7A3A6_9FLAO|nr:hypothetical protein [Abyssalbus ytuae]UOB19086.1 hypothetical protein MQE35_07250 [Abyssalbus ytuae]
MQKYVFLILFTLVISCEYFGLKKADKEQLLEKEMQSINWNDVDKYPLFENCDETASKTVQKDCFQTTLINYILNELSYQRIEVRRNLNDTVNVKLLISNEGKVSILEIQKSAVINQQIPQLDEYIKVAIENLPVIYPALKRDIPVATKFNLPIILKVY